MSGLALLEKKVQHPVLDVSVFEIFNAASDAVQKVIVEMVRAEILERLAVHQH